MTRESCLSEFLFNISCYLRMTLMVRIDLGVPIGPELRRTSLVAQVVKSSPASAGDLGSICGSRRSPGEGSDNPLQYSCLENPTDRGARRATFHVVTKELGTA